jgi:hypothetical protein
MSGGPLSTLALKNKATAAGIKCGYAYITLDNGSKTLKYTFNVFQTTDYGLVCLEMTTSDGCIVWDLGVAGEFRGQTFSQVSPVKLHDAIYWQNATSGYHFTGYNATYTLSW